MAKPAKGEPKKPYSKPTLIVFGTVRDLTQMVGTGEKRMVDQSLDINTVTSDRLRTPVAPHL